jgi:hypothetical protein
MTEKKARPKKAAVKELIMAPWTATPTLEGRNTWYDHAIDSVAANLADRETVMLGTSNDGSGFTVRCIKAYRRDFLENNMRAMHFMERMLNLYHSVAKVRDMPMFSYNMHERMQQQRLFSDNFDDAHWHDYELFIDCDLDKAATIERGWREAWLIVQLFRDYGIPYQLIASSSKGVHIVVDGKHFKGSPKEKLIHHKRFVGSIKELWDMQSVDMNVYDPRRIRKAPYSYDVNTGAIALPLTDDEFASLPESRDILTPSRAVECLGRGLLERPKDRDKWRSLYEELDIVDLAEYVA